MIIDINKYSILKSNLKAISEISYDEFKKISLIKSSLEVVAFDDVSKNYFKKNIKSCDGFWNFKTLEATFIEFKNGAFSVNDILLKYKFSIEVMNKKIINTDLQPNNYNFIIVYNEEFVIKKDHESLKYISIHLLTKGSFSKDNYYFNKINNIQKEIPYAKCFKRNDFENFLKIEY